MLSARAATHMAIFDLQQGDSDFFDYTGYNYLIYTNQNTR